jgi:protein-tyrosine phosphatase
VIDLHCHVLPGIDDGPATIEEAVELARAAAAAGTRVLVATPHVNRRFANEAATIAARTGELNARLAGEGIPVEVRPGAEIAISRATELAPEELRRLTLGGGRWLLLEPPFTQQATGIDILIRDFVRHGHRIVVAHPERCPTFRHDRQMLRALVGEGVLTSITAGSLVGRFGGDVRRFAMELVAEGIVHNVASDAHDRQARPPSIAPELAQSGLGAFAEWWTGDVPGAILGDGEIPRRPPVPLPEPTRARRWRWPRLARAS